MNIDIGLSFKIAERENFAFAFKNRLQSLQ